MLFGLRQRKGKREKNMELLVSILSGILAIATSVNMVGDTLVEKKIRSQVQAVDTLVVRIDNAPNYDVLGGKVQRVRVATRDLKISSAIAFKALEIDMDGININLKEFIQEDLVTEIDDVPTLRLRELFESPVQMASRVVLTQKQLDNILQSQTVNFTLSQRLTDTLNGLSDNDAEFIINSFKLDLIDKNRLALRANIIDLEGEYEARGEELDVDWELSIRVLDGSNFEFFDQKLYIEGEEIEPENDVLRAEPVSLRVLEELGLNVRVLQWNSDQDELELALSVRANKDAASALLDAKNLLEAAKLFLEQ